MGRIDPFRLINLIFDKVYLNKFIAVRFQIELSLTYCISLSHCIRICHCDIHLPIFFLFFFSVDSPSWISFKVFGCRKSGKYCTSSPRGSGSCVQWTSTNFRWTRKLASSRRVEFYLDVNEDNLTDVISSRSDLSTTTTQRWFIEHTIFH